MQRAFVNKRFARNACCAIRAVQYRLCNARQEALRATRLEAPATAPPNSSTSGGSFGGSNPLLAAGGEMGLGDTGEVGGGGGDSAPLHDAVAASADVATAERALRELDSSAAFELEQALWRGGLRGPALQARLQTELEALREQWREHKAHAERAAAEQYSQRSAKKKPRLGSAG